MVRNELLSRSFMLMSFATAALLLTAHWHSQTEIPQATLTPASPSPGVVLRSDLAKTPRSVPTPGLPVRFTYPTPPAAIAPRQRMTSSVEVGVRTSLMTFVTGEVEEPVRLEVDLSDRQVSLYKGGKRQASYPVGIGQPGWETPTGSFRVTMLERDPLWQHPITGQLIPPGPDNPLGSRWIGFSSTQDYEIGFHGTNQPELVGQAISHGCLRMHEADVRQIFEQVEVGTPVIVRP